MNSILQIYLNINDFGLFQTRLLTTVTGNNHRDSFRKMLSKISDKKVWSYYNMKGRKNKTSFEQLNLFLVIKRK